MCRGKDRWIRDCFSGASSSVSRSPRPSGRSACSSSGARLPRGGSSGWSRAGCRDGRRRPTGRSPRSGSRRSPTCSSTGDGHSASSAGSSCCGWRTRRSRRSPAKRLPRPSGARGLPGAYLTMLGLTLTNPMTILSFAALFVGLGVTGGDPAGATVLTLGVFAGSSLWWVRPHHGARGVPVASDDERHAPDQHRLGAAHRGVRARRHRDRATVNHSHDQTRTRQPARSRQSASAGSWRRRRCAGRRIGDRPRDPRAGLALVRGCQADRRHGLV